MDGYSNMSTIKRIVEYFIVGNLHIILSGTLFFLLVVLYFAKMEIQVIDWKNLIQLFVVLCGVLLAFAFRGNINLGLELNKLLGYKKSEFLRDYWKKMKRDLNSMYVAFAGLVVALISLILFEKRSIILSDDLGFLASMFSFVLFMHSFGDSLVTQYLSFEIISKLFSPKEGSET